MDIQAVIFDRDGVVIETESIYLSSTIKALEKLKRQVGASDLKEIHGKHPDDLEKFFVQNFSIPFQDFREYQRKFYYELLKTAKVSEDIISLIKLLDSKNIPVALTTSSGKEGTTKLLKRIGLDKVFSAVVTKEDCEKRKPDPEPYLLTARKLKIKPEHCLVVEDSGVGVKAAKNAGMTCIAVPSIYTQNQDFSRADDVLSSLSEVTKLIRALNVI